jgi:UDP-3-O-[3-hydroxymyristoyl] glucosamine N-acyltransferase
VIGSCGFGYTTDKQGKHTKLRQVGSVKIDDDVEIGANTTIDRGRFKPTQIGRGTKIDNLVQVGHGTCIGEDNMIVAQVGIAGSVETGKHVVLAGQSGVAGHIKLESGAIISAKSGVDKSLKAGKYGGIPARPQTENNRMLAHLHQLDKYAKQIKELEARLAKLEESS